MIFDVEQVFDEVGAENDDFITWVENRFEKDVECSASTHSHDDVRAAPGESISAIEIMSYFFTNFRPAGIGHVLMDRIL